ncbi:MAG TPA: hypothetical protein VGD08_17655 [Stellaceae bacterium]|jgi:hypothetical protein
MPHRPSAVPLHAVAAAGAAIAGAVVQLPAAAPAAAQTRPGFEIGPELYYYRYEEPDFAKLEGAFAAANGSYTFKGERLFLTLNGIAGAGYLDYSSRGTGSYSGTWNYMGDLRALGGGDFTLRDGLVASPYSGLGYRLLFDNSSGTVSSSGARGYDRLSQYLYLPIGVTFGIAAASWTLRPNIEFDLLLHGWQTSYLSTADSRLNDPTNDQNHGYGIRASILAEMPTRFGHLSFGPFVRYWNIRTSDPATITVRGVPLTNGYEPGNHTIEAGGTVRFGF